MRPLSCRITGVCPLATECELHQLSPDLIRSVPPASNHISEGSEVTLAQHVEHGERNVLEASIPFLLGDDVLESLCDSFRWILVVTTAQRAENKMRPSIDGRHSKDLSDLGFKNAQVSHVLFPRSVSRPIKLKARLLTVVIVLNDGVLEASTADDAHGESMTCLKKR